MSTPTPVVDSLRDETSEALRRATEKLLSLQHKAGYWAGLLTADTTLESDYIFLQLWKYPPEGPSWNPPNRARIDKCVESILRRQLPDGGFNIYPGGPADVSASVKAYFALKITGLDPNSDRMARLRKRILELGGLQRANSYTKLNLSFFGLYPREYVPTVPPEMVLVPRLIYEMSSWTRAIVIPLSIVQASGVRRPVPEGFTLQELVRPDLPLGLPRSPRLISWRNFFLTLDRLLQWWERYGGKGWLRRRAIQVAEQWILERSKYSEGLGAIFPPMMYVVMALDVLGYPDEHPARVKAVEEFERLIVEQDGEVIPHPCFSPVWDTAQVLYALALAGCQSRQSIEAATLWLLAHQTKHRGDWAYKRPKLEPGGWYFEFANEFYPDVDDTAMVLLALRSWYRAGEDAVVDAAVDKGLQWLLGMQSSDGGWAAFDVDSVWEPLSHVPFADHRAMLDPSCPDITGRVLMALKACGIKESHPSVQHAVRYLRRTQQADGSWYGRWGVAYIYGTFLALLGLRAAGVDPNDAAILRGAEWLRSIQNADGGWGESCESYATGQFEPNTSTPSQTAWALLGLFASGDYESEAVKKGIEFLVGTQGADGSWQEEYFTGTGFPQVFYLHYDLYRMYFPVMALGEYHRNQRKAGG